MWIIATHCDLHFIGLGANMQADYGKNFLAQNGKQSDWLDAVRARKRAPNRSLSGARSAAYAALAARPMLLAAHTRSRCDRKIRFGAATEYGAPQYVACLPFGR